MIQNWLSFDVSSKDSAWETKSEGEVVDFGLKYVLLSIIFKNGSSLKYFTLLVKGSHTIMLFKSE